MTDPKALPKCKLIDTDGNVFAIMGRVSRTLKQAGQPERAAEFLARARASKSYDEVIGLTFEYVDAY